MDSAKEVVGLKLQVETDASIASHGRTIPGSAIGRPPDLAGTDSLRILPHYRNRHRLAGLRNDRLVPKSAEGGPNISFESRILRARRAVKRWHLQDARAWDPIKVEPGIEKIIS